MTNLCLNTSARSASSDVLNEIRYPACSLAVWERDTIAGIGALLTSGGQDVRFHTRLTQLAEQLASRLDAAGFPRSRVRDDLTCDIARLAQLYCGALDLDELEVRLEIVSTNSCRKWHADYVRARLISTYAGTGSQWLDEDDAERVRLGQDPRRINQMTAGDVGIFKGKLAADAPVIHRSPPIEGTGETRLLLVLNPRDQS